MKILSCPNCRALVPANATCANCGLTFPSPAEAAPGVEGAALDEALEETTLEAGSNRKVHHPLDPHLQRQLVRKQFGVRQMERASVRADEVAVIAKVTDLVAWKALQDVRHIVEAGFCPKEKDTIVTARMPLDNDKIARVRSLPFVKSLKYSQRLRPQLNKATAEIGAAEVVKSLKPSATGGQGVLIGIVDIGFDFNHPNFRNGSTTRLLALWNQRGASSDHSTVPYGRLYLPDEINEALKLDGQAPYHRLQYFPPADDKEESTGAHGTHVADIATGNGRGTGSEFVGIAPQADIVFVDVATFLDLPGQQNIGFSLGDAAQVVEAVVFIFELAQKEGKPCVINLSLGTNGGPHDGHTLVEEALDRLIGEFPERAIVVGAGNASKQRIHVSGAVLPGGQHDLHWQIKAGDNSNNEVEIWYAGEDRFTVEIFEPNNPVRLLEVAPGAEPEVLVSNGQVKLFVANRLDDPNNRDNLIGIFLERVQTTPFAVGQWTIRLKGTEVKNGKFHAWIEKDDTGQSIFSSATSDATTVSSLSCGHQTIAVGTYNARGEPEFPIHPASSAGPTRDDRKKPDVSAPGHVVFVGQAGGKSGQLKKSGTSMSAPMVTGIIALMMAEARARNFPLTAKQMRQILTKFARKTPPDTNGWHPQYGFGRVSATRAIDEIIKLAPNPLPAAPPPPVPE